VSFESIVNRGEFFSNHYLDAVVAGDLGDLRGAWDEAEGRGEPSARARIRTMGTDFFAARATASEARTPERRAIAMHALNDVLLAAFGFPSTRATVEFAKGDVDTIEVPLAHVHETPTGRLLVALEAGMATDIDELFDATPGSDGILLEPLVRRSDKASIAAVPDAVSELFGTDDPPRYVLIAAGTIVLLAERGKWAEGRFLAVDLDGALERHDTKKAGELETIAALFSADGLVPGALTTAEGTSVFESLVEKSHKHAVGVSKELRNSIRQSIEVLANEVIAQRLNANLAVYTGENRVDPTDLTRQCLRWLYRLLVLLYAESRPELGVVPSNDDAYVGGYSLDRLRELVLVDLDTQQSRNGHHLHQSLQRLFDLVNVGYHADHAQQALTFDPADLEAPSREEYLQFPGLDAGLFDQEATPLLDTVTLRNEALQKVLALLMLSPEGRGRHADRGFISYAQLGINQLGAVYEGLMAYTGFFADEDLYEVAKHGDPTDGTWVLPVDDADEYPDDVFVKQTDPITGREERVRHPRGCFVFRLSGRDRQRSASYYTPEVLTRCVVKHALAELLGLDDYAPEHGSSGITEARQILDLTICEPALGSGAFLNEAINQLSAEYLRRRQEELGKTLDPDEYRRELQKVKAHFALHQCYGVDLNATAVELAEVSLWLNCMHPGLKAPWFGLQLRRGNSLIGCRRATWRVSQLADKPWAKTKKGEVIPPVDRPLGEPLDDDEIHHFLLPGHGWAAAADRKEAKELRPEEAKLLREWRVKILKAPSEADAKRLQALSAAVEELWARASERIRLTQQALRRPLELCGATVADGPPTITRAEAELVLNDPDSALGRLRTLMDLWVGLWFWPLDSGSTPPTWNEWITVAEELVHVEQRHGPSGQLGFDDLAAFLELERAEPFAVSVVELKEKHSWLPVVLGAARREGVWHWELEFSPVFRRRVGFDLQVGNPPWVRPRWYDDLVLAESDPWWGTTVNASAPERNARRSRVLARAEIRAGFVAELCAAEGLLAMLNSAIFRPVLTGFQANLYTAFMDGVWRHASARGAIGMLHPEGHFTDPDGQTIRRNAYARLRRHFHFLNELLIFEDVGHPVSFGIHVYGVPREVRFLQCGRLLHPSTADGSLLHDGLGEAPGIQFPAGGWDLRAHRTRVVQISVAVLADWAHLFDEIETPPEEARLLLPVTSADLDAISALARSTRRIGSVEYHWTRGHEEDRARAAGVIRWDTAVPSSWDEAILQGPHFTVATPFSKQPNENCRSKGDYSEWDLESLPERVIPRTNYQRACSRDEYEAALDIWQGRPCSQFFRLAYRRMTQPGQERSLRSALLPPGPMHVNTVHTLAASEDAMTVLIAGLFSSVPFDYLVKVSGKSDVQDELVRKFPLAGGALSRPTILRTMRLNALTRDYDLLWNLIYRPEWNRDRWTDAGWTRSALGTVPATWSPAAPLRREFERRLALVEIDALAAIMLGLTAEQLSAMYRTQFAVLRKYEYQMAFDAKGRKICAYHQSAGFRQSQLQEQAKSGGLLPKEWSNVWKLYEQYESDPASVDWLGHYTPPFSRTDREKEMTRAYEEFQRRVEAGEYD